MAYIHDLNNDKIFQVLIVGGGPAAVAAAIYCKRFDLKTIMIGQTYGGAIANTYLIENYPGFPEVSGFDLMDAFQKHYEKLKIPYIFETVEKINKNSDKIFMVTLSNGDIYYSNTVVLATGGVHRKLNVPGEVEYHGRGVSYCGTCDGPFFRNKKIIVVGGSDSAAIEALFLSRFGSKTYIVYRGEKLRSEAILTERVLNNEKIELIYKTTITEIKGSGKVESVIFGDGTEFPVDAVFIEVGVIPQSELAKNLGVTLNVNGEIIVDKFSQTNVEGLYAAGDVTDIREKQVVNACAQATSAAYSIREYLGD